MDFLIFVAVALVAYFAWRIVDQLPDIVYRLSEIQRDVADVRRRLDADLKPEPDTLGREEADKEFSE